MSNLGIHEQLAHSTIRLECDLQGGENQSFGTGFIFDLIRREGCHVPVIVTNKHVLKDAVLTYFCFTRKHDAGGPLPLPHAWVKWSNVQDAALPHPDAAVDLCVIPLAEIFDKAHNEDKEFFYTQLDVSYIPSREELKDLDVVQDVVMIGYPSAIWDEVNNMPVFRRGITATHPRLDWRGSPEFLIDMACFPGSSGSPVMLCDVGHYTDKHGCLIVGSTRVKLLGILYQGPQHEVEGSFGVRSPKSSGRVSVKTPIPMNIGHVIRAEKLLDFIPLVEERIK